MNKKVLTEDIDKILREFEEFSDNLVRSSLKPGCEPREVEGTVVVKKKPVKSGNITFGAPGDKGDDGLMVRLQEYCDSSHVSSNSPIAKQLKAAMLKSQKFANYISDEKGVSIRVPKNNSAFKNNFASSWGDTHRFNCPSCTTNVTYMSKEELDQRLEDGRITPENYKRAAPNAGKTFKEKVNVSATEEGTCPYCEQRILPNSTYTGGTHRRMKPKDPFSDPKKLHKVYYAVNYVDITSCDFVKSDETVKVIKAPEYDFELTRGNFVGVVNKKSCGRDATGHLSKDPEEVAKHKHDVGIVLKPNMRRVTVPKFVKVTGREAPIQVQRVSFTEPCECGAQHRVYDERRAETVCPKCGLVFSQGGL